jgi:PAS domain S-box-containing protein
MLFHQLLNAVGDGVMDLDFATGEFQYSERWKALLGYESTELRDSPTLWLEMSHPDDRAEAKEKFNDHVKGLWPMVHSWRFAHKTGTYRWLLARALTETSEATGEIEHVFVVFSDLSDQVFAKKRLDALIAAVPDTILRVAKDGSIFDAKVPPGWPADRAKPVPGESFEAWASAEGLAGVLLPLIEAVRANGQYETQQVRSSGTPTVDYEAHVAPGAEDDVVCVLRDVTSRRSLEAQLRQAQRLESIGQLAAGIAHEINTPIQFVSDSVHFLKEAFQDILAVLVAYRQAKELAGSLPVPEQLVQALGEVAEQEERRDIPYLEENVGSSIGRAIDGLERITTIVRSIKEFAHPSSTEKTPTDLNRAIMTTLTIARSEYKYVADVETELGDLPEVDCHPGEINQAILNITVNASHAIGDRFKESGVKGRIGVRTRLVDGFAEIAISDTGGGIPEHIRHRIFDPFFTTKEVGRGTGQGLALARTTIIEKHQGTLTFDTEMGRGTTFYIRLPSPTASAAGTRTEESMTDRSSSSPLLG